MNIFKKKSYSPPVSFVSHFYVIEKVSVQGRTVGWFRHTKTNGYRWTLTKHLATRFPTRGLAESACMGCEVWWKDHYLITQL